MMELSESEFFTDHAGLAAYDNDARWLQAALPRFDAPDPRATEYPHLSPYANRACNPLRYLDPSGEDILNINMRGELVNRIENKEEDKFVIVKEDLTPDTDDYGNEIAISFDYGTVESIGAASAKVPDKDERLPFIWFQVRGDGNGIIAKTKRAKVGVSMPIFSSINPRRLSCRITIN